MGSEYAYLSIRESTDGVRLIQGRNTNPSEGDPDTVVERVPLRGPSARLRATVEDGGRVQFAYATDDAGFESIGEPFQAQQGRWIGAKIGLFVARSTDSGVVDGYCDFEYFEVSD